MIVYLHLRAAELLGQKDLVEFLKESFPNVTRSLPKTIPSEPETVDVRVPAGSSELESIRKFVEQRRVAGDSGYEFFPICSYIRRYTKRELADAEILLLSIPKFFEPSGEECGTIYEALCEHCNWSRQLSDLILDLRSIPQRKDASQTIAWVEWVVSTRLAATFADNGLTGAKFRPIFSFRNPTEKSTKWGQLWITGKAGALANETKLGKDVFAPSELSWRCPLGHSIVTNFLSEIHVHREQWDGSDISVTSSLFGQGRNLLRPCPLILISQRTYRVLRDADLSGLHFEIAHLV